MRDHFAIVCKMKRYREETSQIDNEFKKNRELKFKSIVNLNINNVKIIQGINRTCENTRQLAAK